MLDLPPLMTQAQAALMRTGERPTAVTGPGQPGALRTVATERLLVQAVGQDPTQATFQAEINALLDRGASETGIRDALKGYRDWGASVPGDKKLAFSARLMTGLLTMLPALTDEPAKRDLLGRALGRLKLKEKWTFLTPDTQREIAAALRSHPIETSVPVDLIVDFLRSANSTGRKDLAKGQHRDTPAHEKRYILRNEFTRNGTRSGITQALVGIFAKQVAQNDPPLATACQWVRALAGVFAGDTLPVSGTVLLRGAIGALSLDEASKAALAAALAGPSQPIAESAPAKGVPKADAEKPADPPLTHPAASTSSLHSSSSSSSSTPSVEGGHFAAATLLALARSDDRVSLRNASAGGAAERKSS
jgi:hypothetical protein